MYSKSTSNSTSNSEFKRLILIGIQIRNIFDELTDENENTKNTFQKAVEEKYIKSFVFYAIKSGKSYAELEITIDWNEHQNQIDRGNIVIKTKSQNGILSPTKNVVSRFKDYIITNGFDIEWHFSYSDHINVEQARKKLNSSPAKSIERAQQQSDYVSRDFQVGDLTELTYTMRI